MVHISKKEYDFRYHVEIINPVLIYMHIADKHSDRSAKAFSIRFIEKAFELFVIIKVGI